MTHEITIPPEALEAAKKAYADAILNGKNCDVIEAACLAMLKAWPGATTHEPHSSGHGPMPEQLRLPLPQKETTND